MGGVKGRRQVGVWREEVNCLGEAVVGGGYDHVKIKIKKQMYETSCFSKNAE